MSSQNIKFGDKKVVSSRWKLNDTTHKYFCG